MNDHSHVDDPAVAAVLAAAAAPAEGPVPGEAEALVAFRSVYRPQRRLRMSRFSEKAKLIAAAVFGGVVVISGAATAATGSLPIVSHGHSHQPSTQTPGGDDNDDQGTDVEDSTEAPDSTDADMGANDPNSDHGKLVSDTAHNAPQGHKGPAVCTVASDGKCKAGQDHGQSTADTHGKAHQNTNATTHRQNTAETHGKAHQNTNSLSHRQNGLTTHGQSGQHGNTVKP